MLRKLLATLTAVSTIYSASAQDIARQGNAPVPDSGALSAAKNNPVPEEPKAPAEEEKKHAFSFSGSADVYYRYDFAKQVMNNKTSFTSSHNSFELGMASVKLEHSAGKVSAVVDLGFGKRAEDFSYNDEKSRFALKQLYLSYSPLKNLKLTAGSWATHIGYELVDAYANRNYSMSYMFSYGPFFHTGIKAEASFGKNSFMLGIANPTDLKTTQLEHKYVIAQFATASANDQVKLYLNYMSGKPDADTRQAQYDAVVTGTVSEKFSIGVNGTMASYKLRETDGKFGSAKQWYGGALYLNLDPKPWLGVTFRNEYFNDEKQLNVFSAASKGGNVFASTLSFNFKIDNLIIIPECRFESASQPIYSKSNGDATKTAGNFLVAAVYAF